MKKLFFLIAFAFIGTQAYSQMYIVSTGNGGVNGCSTSYEVTLTTISPTGNITKACISNGNFVSPNNSDYTAGLALINQELNNIISQGYKLIHTDGQLINPNGGLINAGVSFYLAIPWNPSGLEEVPQTLKNLNIYPNPANDFIDIVLDYDIKSSTEIIVYSEAGYIYHKEKISNLNKNEPYRLDISKVPAGKYFITIVNEKTYTTAQKLIII